VKCPRPGLRTGTAVGLTPDLTPDRVRTCALSRRAARPCGRPHPSAARA
jgi:hypothetical protein